RKLPVRILSTVSGENLAWTKLPRESSFQTEAVARLLALGTCAEMVPDDKENYRDSKDERRDSVDFRRHAATKAAQDFEREGIVATDEEKSNCNFVHRKRKDQQTSGDET